MARTETPSRFDEAYFTRFYEVRRTKVRTRAEVARTARGIVPIVEWMIGDIDGVIEIGAGPGYLRDWFAKNRPKVAYRSTDISPYACARYGHERRDITAWKARARFDLVVCTGVFTYLPNEACEKAIENLAAMARTFLFLEAETKHDLATLYADPRTDAALLRRSARWYRTRLEKHFVQLAFGLWVKRDVSLHLGELDRGP